MKRFWQICFILLVVFFNIKVSKALSSFDFGNVEIYDNNHIAATSLQSDLNYFLEFQFTGFPIYPLENNKCVVLVLNISGNVTIQGQNYLNIPIGCNDSFGGIGSQLNFPLQIPYFGIEQDDVLINFSFLSYDATDFQNFLPIGGGSISKKIFTPKFQIDVKSDKEYYKKEDEIELTVEVTNSGDDFENAAIEFLTPGIKVTDVSSTEIDTSETPYLKLGRMSTGNKKVFTVKGIVTDNTRVYFSTWGVSLKDHSKGIDTTTVSYDIETPHVVTTNTFNLEDIKDNEDYTFTVKFTNDGHVSSGKFSSSFTLNEGLKIIKADGAVIDGNKLTWYIDDIKASESKEYTITVQKVKEIDDEVVINPDIDYGDDNKTKPEDNNTGNNNNNNKPSSEYADKETENPKTFDVNYLRVGVLGTILIGFSIIYFKSKTKKKIFKV